MNLSSCSKQILPKSVTKMKLILIFIGVSQILIFIGIIKTFNNYQYPKCASGEYPPRGKPVKWYTINLDQPPEERWKEIMLDKGIYLKKALGKIMTFIKEIANNSSIPGDLIETMMVGLGNEMPSPIKEEMVGIAKYGNISYGEIVLYNVFYDLNPLCTSIVAQDATGRLYHGRNLDYGIFEYKHIKMDIKELLREGAVNINFTRNGAMEFLSTGYAGYTGIMTGMKPKRFTFTYNARHYEGIENYSRYVEMLEWILGLQPVNWVAPMLRDLMENSKSYDNMKEALQRREMIAPVYFILGGTKPGEACIITRGTFFQDTLCMNRTKEEWYVLQTNYDHWKPTPDDDRRRYDGQHCMNTTGQKSIGFGTLYNVLSSKPVLNEETTYTTLMQVDGHYETYVRDPPCDPPSTSPCV